MEAMIELNEFRPSFNTITNTKKYRQLEFKYEAESRSLWTYMAPSGTSCFNPGLIAELCSSGSDMRKNGGKFVHDDEIHTIDYHIIASRVEHVFSYGGDLALFVPLIETHDREGLLHYAKRCIDGMYPRIVNYDSPLITISLVQGEALGGGFEFALTSNVIVAEETANMGLPEILFNLFPGMGAYSLLTRRVGAKKAEEMILGGKIYSAAELHEMGVVDVLAAPGEGEQAVHEYMRTNNKHLNGMRATFECRRHTHPVSYEELMNITEVWVDAALRLQDKDLRMMDRLVRAQLRKLASA